MSEIKNLSQVLYKEELINKDDLLSDLESSTLIAKTAVPYSHRKLANKYNVLKDICAFQIVQPRITLTESDLLSKYSFKTLDSTTISQINKELMLLKDWAISTDDHLREDAIKLLEIRIKELKFILSNNYSSTNELMNGYKAIETYLIGVSKYYN